MNLPEWLDNVTLPDWVHWLAQDADGQWWGYEVEPQQYHAGWYENEIGRNIALEKEQPNTGWSLQVLRIK
jgi:hypothetical protein